MKLSERKRKRLIAWLESMPWWEALPFAQLEAEIERLRDAVLNLFDAMDNNLPYVNEAEDNLRALLAKDGE